MAEMTEIREGTTSPEPGKFQNEATELLREAEREALERSEKIASGQQKAPPQEVPSVSTLLEHGARVESHPQTLRDILKMLKMPESDLSSFLSEDGTPLSFERSKDLINRLIDVDGDYDLKIKALQLIDQSHKET